MNRDIECTTITIYIRGLVQSRINLFPDMGQCNYSPRSLKFPFEINFDSSNILVSTKNGAKCFNWNAKGSHKIDDNYTISLKPTYKEYLSMSNSMYNLRADQKVGKNGRAVGRIYEFLKKEIKSGQKEAFTKVISKKYKLEMKLTLIDKNNG